MQTYCWPGHQTQLLRALQRQQNNAQHCDTLLQTEGISIPAHSCVLAALSPYLSQNLSSVPGPPTGQKRHLRLPNVPSGTLLKLVALLYSGELKVNGDAEQRDVLAAAQSLGISGLEVGWTNRGAQQRRGRTTKVQDVQVQVDMSSRRGGAPQETSVASTSTQTDPDPGGGRDPTINSLPIPTRLINESNATSAAPHPVVIQRTTGCDNGGVKSSGKGSGGTDVAGQPRRTAIGVKSVARMRQMMESAQISIKVKLRRRTTGEASWEVVNIQDSDKTLVDNISLKQVHPQCSVSDSSPRSSTSFSTDQSMELEPPQALLEETDEQMERLLEDIMFGLNILPSLEKDCKKTQASDTDVHHAPVPHTLPPSQCPSPQRSEVVTPRDPQGSGDDPSSLCFDNFWLPQCLSPLATCSSPSNAQVSEIDRTGIPSRAWFPEVPASLHLPPKEDDAPRRQNSKDPECEERERVSNCEKTTKESNQQIPECSVNLSCQNLLATHQNLRSALLGQCGATSVLSVEQPRVMTRGSTSKTQLVQLKTGTESSARTLRRGRTSKIKVESAGNVGKDPKDTENMAKVKNEETNVDGVNPVEKNVQKVKRNVKKMKKNVENNMKDVEIKEKKVENERNVKKNMENMKKRVENNTKDVKIKKKMVKKEVENVREEEEGALKRRSRKQKRGVGKADAIPRNGKRKREKETVVDDKDVSRAETFKWFQEFVQQQTFKRRRSKGSTETRTRDVSTAKEDEGQCVKTTEEERECGGITAARMSEEGGGGSDEAERRLTAAAAAADDDDDDDDDEGSDEERRQTIEKSCEEEVDVVLCSPLRDTPTCLSHAHSEDTCEDDEDVDVTGD